MVWGPNSVFRKSFDHFLYPARIFRPSAPNKLSHTFLSLYLLPPLLLRSLIRSTKWKDMLIRKPCLACRRMEDPLPKTFISPTMTCATVLSTSPRDTPSGPTPAILGLLHSFFLSIVADVPLLPRYVYTWNQSINDDSFFF